MLFILITAITLPWLPGVFSTEALVLRLNQTHRDYVYRRGYVSGRLDVRYRGTWGNICLWTFHSSEARVACRQLGYTGGNYDRDHKHDPYMQGIFRRVRCDGRESRLDECRLYEGPYPCDVEEFIVLECKINPELKGLLNATLLGSTGYTGILEVTTKDGRKAAVCFDPPQNNTSIGKTVCGQMGYSDILSTLVANQDSYKANSFVSVLCDGTKPTLASCSMTAITNCPSAKILGLACKLNMTTQKRFDLRLSSNDSSANEGTVEVYKYGRWGVICDTGWDLKAAQVVCRQLGFRYAYSARHDAYFGQGTGIVFWNNVRCSGDEPSISECKYDVAFEKGTCNSWNAAGVVCSPKRLPKVNICSGTRMKFTLPAGVSFVRSQGYPQLFSYNSYTTCSCVSTDVKISTTLLAYVEEKMFQQNHVESLTFLDSSSPVQSFGDSPAAQSTKIFSIRFESGNSMGHGKFNIRIFASEAVSFMCTKKVGLVTATTPAILTTTGEVTLNSRSEETKPISETGGNGAVGGVVGSLITIILVVITGVALWKTGFVHFGKREEDYKSESDAAPTQGEATTENPTEIYENLPNRQASVNGPIYENSAFLRDSESETAVVNSGDPVPAESTYEDLRRQGNDSTAPVEAVQGDTDVNNDNVGESPYAKLGEVDASVYLDFRELKAKQT